MTTRSNQNNDITLCNKKQKINNNLCDGFINFNSDKILEKKILSKKLVYEKRNIFINNLHYSKTSYTNFIIKSNDNFIFNVSRYAILIIKSDSLKSIIINSGMMEYTMPFPGIIIQEWLRLFHMPSDNSKLIEFVDMLPSDVLKVVELIKYHNCKALFKNIKTYLIALDFKFSILNKLYTELLNYDDFLDILNINELRLLLNNMQANMHNFDTLSKKIHYRIYVAFMNS